MMVPNDPSPSRSGCASGTLCRPRGNALSSRILAGLGLLLMLLLVGRGIALALDSPLLGIVAVGMLFLIGVATTGAVSQSSR